MYVRGAAAAGEAGPGGLCGAALTGGPGGACSLQRPWSSPAAPPCTANAQAAPSNQGTEHKGAPGYVCAHLPMPVPMSVCLSVCPSVRLSVCGSVRTGVHAYFIA